MEPHKVVFVAPSLIIYNIIINYTFWEIESGIGKSLYGDDGALRKRGRNLQYIRGKNAGGNRRS